MMRPLIVLVAIALMPTALALPNLDAGLSQIATGVDILTDGRAHGVLGILENPEPAPAAPPAETTAEPPAAAPPAAAPPTAPAVTPAATPSASGSTAAPPLADEPLEQTGAPTIGPAVAGPDADVVWAITWAVAAFAGILAFGAVLLEPVRARGLAWTIRGGLTAILGVVAFLLGRAEWVFGGAAMSWAFVAASMLAWSMILFALGVTWRVGAASPRRSGARAVVKSG